MFIILKNCYNSGAQIILLFNLILLGFYGGFIALAWLIKPLAIGVNSTFSPSSLLGGQGVGLKVPTF